MKSKIIKQISEIVKNNKVSSTEWRYISQQIRNQNNLVIPKRPKKLPNYLNSAEIYYLMQEASKDNFSGVLIEFLIFTGLRISEASRIMIQDIDFENNQLKVIRGKGSKDRHVPITNNLIHKIKLYINKRNTGFLFCKSDGKKYTTRALQIRITNIIKNCNFSKKLSTHSLRHTFACLCIAKGIKMEQIQLLMGHSTIKTTEIYAKLELGSIKEEFLKLMGNHL